MGKKAPKSTPRTTAINPQAVAHTFTAFSPLSDKATPLYYAHLHAAPDAHTLRVYSIDGKCVSRWASNAHGDEAASHGGDNSADEPRVRCIEWCSIPAAAADEAVAQQQAEGKRGKKRRKSDGGGAVDSPAKPTSESLRSSAASSAAQLLLALGLENGSILLWQPTGTQARTLSHPASNSPVTALAAPAGDATTGHLWSAHHDGSVRVWDLESGNVIGKVAGLAEESRWDDLLVRYEAPGSRLGQADSAARALAPLVTRLHGSSWRSVEEGGQSPRPQGDRVGSLHRSRRTVFDSVDWLVVGFVQRRGGNRQAHFPLLRSDGPIRAGVADPHHAGIFRPHWTASCPSRS